jgi:hypothetical protein
VRAGNVQTLGGRGLLISADIQAMMRGNLTNDQALRSGDVVVVPETGVTGLQNILSILTFIFGLR